MHIHRHRHVHACAHARLRTCTLAHMHAYAHARLRTCVCVRTCMHAHMHACTSAYTNRTHTQTQTQTHTTCTESRKRYIPESAEINLNKQLKKCEKEKSPGAPGQICCVSARAFSLTVAVLHLVLAESTGPERQINIMKKNSFTALRKKRCPETLLLFVLRF